MRLMERVCIVGSGYMGWQIALQCVRNGFFVSLYDISNTALIKALDNLNNQMDSMVRDGQVNQEQKNSALKRISVADDLVDAVRGVDLVIEAVPERLELKRKVFNELDKLCGNDAVLATNSSSIRISKIEDVTMRKDRVLNTHFYSNPWRNRIVELMRGTSTSDETMRRVSDFMRAIGMIPLTVKKESTGFIFNRVWRAVKKECLHLVDDGVASFEDVDRAWMSLYGMEVGPFGMMDRVGLDVVRDIEMVYYEESGDEADAPPKLLLDKVSKGELGVKTGKGFYTYPVPAYQDPNWLEGQGS